MGEDSNTADGLEVSDLESRAPGSDPEDPYEDVDISELPAWWRRAIAEHREYDLRPYRPPRFEDGTLKHTVVDDLEREESLDIDFIDLDVEDEDWQVRIDGEVVGNIGRRRSTDGYTVFEMEADEFRTYVRSRIPGSK
jgi:hypothetical protein